MSVELDVYVDQGQIRGVPVPVTTVDVTPIMGPCQLVGWSLREASGELSGNASGSVTSPGALATIATTASLPAGTYQVAWQVELAGTLAAGDSNNFQLVDSAGVVLASINAAVAGVYPQGTAEVVTTVAGAILVRANAAGTVGAVYSAEVDATPAIGIGAMVELQDGNQPLGESSMQTQGTDTETMPGTGVRVSGMIRVHVISGAVAGVIYARFDKQS